MLFEKCVIQKSDILTLTKNVIKCYKTIDLLQSIGLNVEPIGSENNVGDNIYSVITETTKLILDKLGVSNFDNYEIIQERLDEMLANHDDTNDLSEFEKFYWETPLDKLQ